MVYFNFSFYCKGHNSFNCKNCYGRVVFLYIMNRIEIAIKMTIKALYGHNSKAAGPDKTFPSFLPHLGPFFISLLMSIFNKSWAETKVPQEWRVADIRPARKEGRMYRRWRSIDLYPYIYLSLTSTVGNAMERLVTNCRLFWRIDAPANRTPSSVYAWSQHRGPTALIVIIYK